MWTDGRLMLVEVIQVHLICSLLIIKFLILRDMIGGVTVTTVVLSNKKSNHKILVIPLPPPCKVALSTESAAQNSKLSPALRRRFSAAMAERTVSERGHVSPVLSAPAGPTRLPLTYLDLPWLFFHPSQRLFFYDYPHPASRIASAALPLLKSSLSLALRLFYPLAGHLHAAPARRPTIACPPTSACVGFKVAESGDDFHDLRYNDTRCPRQRASSRFHPLVPALASGEGHSAALMAVQITVFPGSGFSVGIAYQHVAADERTFNNFIKAWASFCSRALTGWCNFLFLS